MSTSRERWDAQASVANPGVASPGAVAILTHVVAPIVRVVHRATLEGTEHLPAAGAYLLVANHPSCLGISEFHSFMALYARAFGRTRPLAGFVPGSPLALVSWFPARITMRIGAPIAPETLFGPRDESSGRDPTHEIGATGGTTSRRSSSPRS